MGDTLSPCYRNKRINMRPAVLICGFLACVSSAPLDAGYGLPAAPVVVAAPTPLVHHAPIIHHAPAPLIHHAPAPLIHHAPFAPAAPLPVRLVHAPIAHHVPAPLPVAPAPVVHHAAHLPLPFAPPPSSQFHAQDEFGQFSFGHQDINSAKVESRDAFGNVRGSYQYVDANGIIQTVNYIADPVNGFRVEATNLPVGPSVPEIAALVSPVAPAVPEVVPLVAPVPVEETPEVAAARAEHLKLVAEATAAAEAAAAEDVSAEDVSAERKRREAEPVEAEYGVPAAPIVTVVPTPLVHHIPAPVVHHVPSPLVHHLPAPLVHHVPAPVVHHLPAHVPAPVVHHVPAPVVHHAPLSFSAPLPVAPAPVVHHAAHLPLPIAPPPSSQFHAQDEFGQFSFGHQDINSAKVESRDAFGNVRGSYQYVDANGILQTVNYIADPVNGFRVEATNLPVGPSVPEIPALVSPVAPAVPEVVPLVAPVPVEETPEVAAARAEHLKLVAEATAAAEAA